MKQKHDWDGLVRQWITEKTAEPVLDMTTFFKRHGFTSETQCKRAAARIGRAMGVAYAFVRDKAMQETQDLASAELGRLLSQMLGLRKTQLAIGMKKITAQKGGVTDSKGNPIPQFEPANFSEAELVMEHGVKGITDIIRLLTGGEPMMPTQPRKVVFDFVPVARYHKPERKKRSRKD